MKNTKKRGFLAGAGALLTAAAFALGGATAAQALPSVDQDEANLNIIKLSTPTNGPVASDGSAVGTLPEGAQRIQGVTFSVQRVEGIDLATNQGWQSASALSFDSATGIVTGNGDNGDPVTLGAASYGTTNGQGIPENSDAAGTISSGNAFQGLPIGVYVVTETRTPAGVTPAVPFLVTLPLTNPAGDAWVYNVYAYPKNSQVGITKTVSDTPKYQAGTAGALVTWTINADVPRIADETTPNTWVQPTGFVINDAIDDRLAAQSVTVKAVDIAGDDIAGANALVAADFSISPALPAAAGADVAVTFTPAGLVKLHALAATAGNKIQVTVTTQVQAGAAGTIPNSASVVVNGGDPLVVTTPPVTEWREVSFTKQNEAGIGRAGAKFKVYDTKANAVAAATAGMLLSSEVTSQAAPNLGTVGLGSLIRSDFVNGSAITGTLAQYRVYWLLETVAPDGYELLAAPVPFVVLDDGIYNVTVNGAGQVTAVGDELSVVTNVEHNAGFNLPLTGGMGTAILTIAGIALLAVVLLVARRRRSAEATAE